MKEQDNPFKYRHVEQIETSSTFLNLFGPSIIDLVPLNIFINQAIIFVSTPGGGKTSLFRIFKPKSLNEIIANQSRDDYVELFKKLKERDVLSETRPKLLGVYLSCARNYSELEYLKLDRIQKNHLFLSLINSRLILIALQGILELKGLKRTDLNRISFAIPEQLETLPKSPFPCNGQELYDWASKIEVGICEILDSYEHSYNADLARADNLDYLHALNPKNITIDGESVIPHTLVMLDDVNFLSKPQHDALFDVLKKHQTPLPIWIAERKEALDFEEMLPGNIGREFNIVEIEADFRKKGKKFENFVTNVADRRAKLGILDINNFSLGIDESLDTIEWQKQIHKIILEVRKRVDSKALTTKKFDNWILEQEKEQGTAKEKAIGWRTLEIQIQRNLSGGQQQIFDSPIDNEERDEGTGAIKPAAEFFIADEFRIPYFYGMTRLAYLASYNVEQFLELAGSLFDEVISKYILKKQPLKILPQEQDSLIRKIARRYWADIPKSIPNGAYAAKLLEEMGNLARKETMRPTAPYLPGVTGIGLSTEHYLQIKDRGNEGDHEYSILKDTLHSCIANNLLYPEYDYKQGVKASSTHVVLQLNRLLCVHFGLPLGYGGWRKKSPADLIKWLKPQLEVVKSNDK